MVVEGAGQVVRVTHAALGAPDSRRPAPGDKHLSGLGLAQDHRPPRGRHQDVEVGDLGGEGGLVVQILVPLLLGISEHLSSEKFTVIR